MFERDRENFNDLVRLLSLSSAKGIGITDEQIRTRLFRAYQSSFGEGIVFDDLALMLDADDATREQIDRKAAWTFAHAVPDAKVWGVNLNLSPQDDRICDSDVVKQVEQAGVSIDDRNALTAVQSMRVGMRTKPQACVDVLAVSHDRKRIYVVKATSFSRAKSRRCQLAAKSREEGNLFSAGERLITALRAPSSALATLLLARTVLQTRFHRADVIPIYMVVDDVGAGWHFECYNMDDLFVQHINEQSVAIEHHPVFASSLAFASRLQDDSDLFTRLPASCTDQPLYMIPPDRAARTLMVLDVLRHGQIENAKSVVGVRASHIADSVQGRFDVYYPKDMRRHDLIAAANGEQFIARVRGGPGLRYGLTPVGLARYYLFVAKTMPAGSAFIDTIMDHLTIHSELVWKSKGI